MKKLGILFATVIMIMFLAFSVNALEPTGQCGDNVYWNFDESTGELVISGEGEMWNYKSKDWWGGYPSPFEKSPIVKLIIDDNVLNVGNEAFAACSDLQYVKFGNKTTSIGFKAFYQCKNLTDIINGDNLISISRYAFDETKWYDNQPDGIISIGKVVYKYKGDILEDTIKIEDGITSIASDAFWRCKNLESVIFPDTLTSIGESAFEFCTNLENIINTDNIEYVGSSAFLSTKWLENQKDGVVYIGKVLYCYDIKSSMYLNVEIIEGTVSVTDYAFSGEPDWVYSLNIPDSVKTIGEYAFQECKNLKELYIGNSVEYIGYGAFSGCDSLKSVEIPKSVKEICGEAFISKSLIEAIILSNTVELGEYAFGYLNSYSTSLSGGEEFPVRCEEFQIKSLKGSSSETYAIENGITFIEYIPHTHTYTPTTTQEPTCWREGETTYTCTCGESYTEAIAKLDHEYRPWETKKNPTCTAPGLEWSYCLLCDNDFEREIPATGHTIIDYTRRATPDSDGAYVTACDVCNEVFKSISFGRPTEYKLSTTKYTYDGKIKTPKLTVETSDGVVLKEGVDYELELPSGRKAVGVYTYRVVFKGNFLGEKKVSYQILPGKTSKITATQSTSAIKLTWKKVTGADGYRVYQYNSKTGKYEKIKTTTGTSYTVKKLKAGTTYKFAVKAYTKDNSETLWAASYKTFTTATKPATPTVKATANNNKVTLKWSKVTGATGYVVYMQDEFGDYKKIGSTKKTSYSVKNLEYGETCRFRVVAYKKVDGKNIYGGYKTVKITVPYPAIYVTPTGKRYHFDKECAGKNAIKTTYANAIKGRTPCKTCVL